MYVEPAGWFAPSSRLLCVRPLASTLLKNVPATAAAADAADAAGK